MLSLQDSKLLAILRTNARASVSELARALGLSRSTVQNRLEKLQSSGVIKGYIVDYGSEYLNQLVCAHISIKVNQKQTPQTNEQLQKISQIASLYAISGEYDLIAVIQADSLVQLNHIIDDIAGLDGVERTNSSIILETKFNR